MKRKLFSLFLLFSTLQILQAQTQWYDPMKAGFPVIQNQGFTKEISNSYTRLPQRAENIVRESVWDLSRHSAGLSINFYTNTSLITVRYTTGSKNYAMPHMPSTGVSGVDLYRIDNSGKWDRCFQSYSFKDTVTYTFKINPQPSDERGYEYRLYLPLYNSVKWMEIGVTENSSLTFIPTSTEKPIILYGTSIAQGGCVSHPAMAWGTILHRAINIPLINLGFSGNGRLEKEVLDYINEIESALYILDCIPNLTGMPEEVEQRTINAVRQIRSKHATTPILLIEHAGYCNEAVDKYNFDSIARSNQGSRQAYEKLINETSNLYYISREELGLTPDMLVDYVHPNDLGMMQQATVVEKKVREILHLPVTK